MATANATEAGPIRADESYLLSDFMKRVKLGRWAIRSARRNGLKVVHTAGRAYVRGSAWLEYLENQAR